MGPCYPVRGHGRACTILLEDSKERGRAIPSEDSKGRVSAILLEDIKGRARAIPSEDSVERGLAILMSGAILSENSKGRGFTILSEARGHQGRARTVLLEDSTEQGRAILSEDINWLPEDKQAEALPPCPIGNGDGLLAEQECVR